MNDVISLDMKYFFSFWTFKTFFFFLDMSSKTIQGGMMFTCD